MNDELEDLLRQLSVGNQSTTIEITPDDVKVDSSNVINEETKVETTEQNEIVNVNDSELIDNKESEPQSAIEALNVTKFIDKFHTDYEITLLSLNQDRAKLNELARILLEKVSNHSATGPETESCVKALQAMVDSAGHRVKLLDSMAKIMQSAKSTYSTVIQQNFGSSEDNSQLIDLLQSNESYEA